MYRNQKSIFISFIAFVFLCALIVSCLKLNRSATYMIAASDAMDNEKAQSNMICTGTNDESKIRSALVAMNDLSNAWTLYSNNAVMTFGKFPMIWFDGTTYHAYYSYDQFTKIGHATSSDGITWTDDVAHNPILTTGVGKEWDNQSVAIFNAWKEGPNWYALYRGNGDKIGLTTSKDGISWTKSGYNPVISNIRGVADPAGIIKVGTTYYLYTNTTGGDRQVNILTSTNLIIWTLQAKSPLLLGDRFCSTPFAYNGYYYLLVSRSYNSRTNGMIELYKSSSPLFPENDRIFLGVVIFSNIGQIDTPNIIVDNISKISLHDNKIRLFYSLGDRYTFYLHLAVENDISAAITKAIIPKSGVLQLSSGTFYLTPYSPWSAFDIYYGNIVQGNNSVLKLKDSYNRDTPCIVFVSDDHSTIRNLDIDGNAKNNTGTQVGLLVSGNAVAQNITLHNFRQK